MNFKVNRFKKRRIADYESFCIDKNNKPLPRRKNPLIPIVTRTLICVLVIDLAIWGYFAFFEKVSLSEGLNGWVVNTRIFFGLKQEEPKQVIYGKAPTYRPRRQIENYSFKKNGQKSPNEAKIYKWRDKDGNLHFSNTNFPANNPTLEITNEKNHSDKETKFVYKGGTIIIPAIISNNGRKEKIKLMLDTGCSTTSIHPDVVKRLRPKVTGYGTSTFADGRKTKNKYVVFDEFSVGPFREINFRASTNKIKNKNGYDGLLGMNFLDNHPFEIDKKKKVIRWK